MKTKNEEKNKEQNVRGSQEAFSKTDDCLPRKCWQ